jgi:hypothetical protein
MHTEVFKYCLRLELTGLKEVRCKALFFKKSEVLQGWSEAEQSTTHAKRIQTSTIILKRLQMSDNLKMLAFPHLTSDTHTIQHVSVLAHCSYYAP